MNEEVDLCSHRPETVFNVSRERGREREGGRDGGREGGSYIAAMGLAISD